ncbi:type I-F CRISPR-associated protein Csy2 [uncultured Shewanella sp.]|uniref:type I-F CRISPR-associated protein Csy2 n=1 Tax=uncultured Shewanella sp. TaxID=173975 RepID=UPI002607BB29|nr:type I-F CRISPR-associated protein Csy2 [uncultured Shewanella sp.]
MVNKGQLNTLLEIGDIQERTVALRRGFTAYTEPLDVTGHEKSALIILLNLTYSRKLVDDLLDHKLAKTTLMNNEHIGACIKEVQWLHTHNLKYPDIRVSKQRLIAVPSTLLPSVLSGANCKQIFGWSHDSAKVNLAKLFGAHFIWQDKACCLARLLSVQPKEWKMAFQSLGMSVKHFVVLCNAVKNFLPESALPEKVDKYSVQVRMPYRDGYLAITPVVNHALQASIQQTAFKKQGRYTNIEFTRPAGVSDLAASLGGNIKVLNYPPSLHPSVYGLSHSWLSRMRNGQTVFNSNALKHPEFIKALKGLLLSDKALVLKQRRRQKVASHRQIRSTLSQWLAPIIEWRLAVEENNDVFNQLEEIEGSLEYQLLTVPNEQLPESLVPLLSLFNTELSNLNTNRQYAFHQHLMKPFKHHLQWLLAHIDTEKSVVDDDEETPTQRYLYLKGIRVFDANALSNPYCVGIPSLTAVWGMMHHYQRRLNERLNTQLRMTSFSWFIRQYSSVKGKKLPEFGMQGQKENQFRRSGIIDNRYCDLVFDLIVHIDGDEDELDTLDHQSDILKASFPASFAGGVMHPPELGSTNDWCELYHCEASLYSTLSRLPMSGKWIMPTRYSLDNLEALLLLLKQKPSLCPVMSGYVLLDKPKSRKHSLEPLHCYAESVIGVVECATAIDIRLQGIRHFFRRAFWMLDVKECTMLMKRI